MIFQNELKTPLMVMMKRAIMIVMTVLMSTKIKCRYHNSLVAVLMANVSVTQHSAKQRPSNVFQAATATLFTTSQPISTLPSETGKTRKPKPRRN